VANTLAYYNTATITAIKSFIVQAPGANVIKQLQQFFMANHRGKNPTISRVQKPQ
jgi:hypothetical protein